ncbi:uncharacterized protein LOC131288253 [Anopheles ziemanni]|uniref:uncharacterized protein LOC131260975 n=1 Tax=Anopheles coustani TaxID=139045 RepID=UPI002659D1A4|nr:uncharacterized protein LOC131260975 [Anopheles coustani]XP_058173353.1 uncharacterized protein LOC131288253 [Anopheles ziemanni]
MRFLDTKNDHILRKNKDVSPTRGPVSPLSVYYQNVGGLRSKLIELRLALSNCKYDIIVFTETWLNESIPSSYFSDERYVIFRWDRKNSPFNRGGGVLIACRSTLGPAKMEPVDHAIEQVWVRLTRTNPTIVLGAIYLPSVGVCNVTTNDVLSKSIHDITCLTTKNDMIFVMGNFNQRCISWTGPRTFSDKDSNATFDYYEPIREPTGSLHFVNAIDSNKLLQLSSIKNPNERQLDLVFGNIPAAKACSEVQKSEAPIMKVDPHHPALQMSISVHPTGIFNLSKSHADS